jgi:nucleoside-diphosphate-sugar epimerase
METEMSKTALILGASGKIGGQSAKAFAATGWEVRRYDRKSEDMTRAAEGADVIVNGLNPPNYHNWDELIPAITMQVIAAARASGATVILPGNVYNFGAEPGPWSENTPQHPTSRKGRIRVEMERSYREAGLRTIVLRAGNFIDPDANDDVMAHVYYRAIRKGKITSPGDPSALQALCYVPDWARAAVALAEKREALAVFEDIPFPGYAITAQDMAQALEPVLQRKLRVTGFPWWVMTLSAPFLEVARELLEMKYLWSTSHRLDDAKFRRLLPDFVPTPMLDALIRSLPDDLRAGAEKRAARTGPALAVG